MSDTEATPDTEQENVQVEKTPDIFVEGIINNLQCIAFSCSNPRERHIILSGCVMLLGSAQPNYLFRTFGMGGTNVWKMEIWKRNKNIRRLTEGEMLGQVEINL